MTHDYVISVSKNVCLYICFFEEGQKANVGGGGGGGGDP